MQDPNEKQCRRYHRAGETLCSKKRNFTGEAKTLIRQEILANDFIRCFLYTVMVISTY